jgi:hypothetical protein
MGTAQFGVTAEQLALLIRILFRRAVGFLGWNITQL